MLFNAPTRKPEPFSARFWRPECLGILRRIPGILGQTIPSPRCLNRLTECSIWNPLGATGGTQTHSRRTGRKLEQLYRARQGLVRVPESNTKYGGKWGKTGVTQVPSVEPSISESSGIPKRKKLFRTHQFRLRPAVHRATIYCRKGVAPMRLT
jgi:hypothetical protein